MWRTLQNYFIQLYKQKTNAYTVLLYKVFVLNSNDIKSEQMETFTEVYSSLHVSLEKKVVLISCVSLL